MKRFQTKFNLLLLCLMTTMSSTAQESAEMKRPEVEMADVFYQDGKIYVVIGVLVIIFVGLFLYLFMTDKRLKKVEKELKNQE